MTFVGKILVIVIMAFALLFLGISTVVFTTHTNWKTATEEQKKKVSELQRKSGDVTAQLDGAKKDLEKAVADHKSAITQSEGRVTALQGEIQTLNTDITATRAKLEESIQSAQVALAEAADRRSETDQIRTQRSAVEKQANEFKLRQTELNDKIRELERQNKTLDDNNKDLRERVARFSTALRKAGLSDDVSTYRGIESPPAVQGEVTRVDANNSKVEISVGSDDGLVTGHELYLYRTQPTPAYIGKIQVLSVDPDRAVGKVINKTVNGIKIQEGDIVSSTIRPRS